MSSPISGMSDNYYNMSEREMPFTEEKISGGILVLEHLGKLEIKVFPIYTLSHCGKEVYSDASAVWCRSNAPLWLHFLEYFINLSTA